MLMSSMATPASITLKATELHPYRVPLLQSLATTTLVSVSVEMSGSS